jgi:hypothetical protein
MRWAGHVAHMERKRAYRVLVGKSEQKDNLIDLGSYGRISKLILKKYDKGVDWIELAHDRDRWRALVNAIMNLRVP